MLIKEILNVIPCRVHSLNIPVEICILILYIMIQVYKKEIERLMEENTLLKMHLAQKEKEAKEAKENENE